MCRPLRRQLGSGACVGHAGWVCVFLPRRRWHRHPGKSRRAGRRQSLASLPNPKKQLGAGRHIPEPLLAQAAAHIRTFTSEGGWQLETPTWVFPDATPPRKGVWHLASCCSYTECFSVPDYIYTQALNDGGRPTRHRSNRVRQNLNTQFPAARMPRDTNVRPLP